VAAIEADVEYYAAKILIAARHRLASAFASDQTGTPVA
jgi:hypothetical protein